MDCSLGQVVDLSASGVRVLSRKKLAGQQTIVFNGLDRQPLRLRAQVLWHRRHAPGEHIHGLRFERMSHTQRELLEQLVLALTNGAQTPAKPKAGGFGVLGASMLIAAGVMLAVAMVWSGFNQAIFTHLPGVYHALNSIPELGALLAIAAGGCGLLGITQRSIPQTQQADTQRRHRAQIELDQVRQSQNILNGILESSLGGVCVLGTLRDDAGTCTGFSIQLINPSGEQLIGKGEKELVGKTLEAALPELIDHELYLSLIHI